MAMLENEKSMLVYGLNEEQISDLQIMGVKLIVVKDEMVDMKIDDILSGLRFEIVNNKLDLQEQIIIFNNLPDEELKMMIGVVKGIVKNPILAMVTESSRQWEFINLAKHLIEERNWHMEHEKGKL
ncbi:DUF3783 domain-containing protein [Clostridium tarantellae]|uniref:DUF3783 domain-containing protein n=1 Tax=Clostridium tarantellae TaxID=39493 RepID=A0A6I1MQ62_9CLOT|nr:DUF3783 domain-containing protein [Clostridium tarantellae]MPQ44382.1 DUF3783 domain-containing protein [Clostridium tarantellae]